MKRRFSIIVGVVATVLGAVAFVFLFNQAVSSPESEISVETASSTERNIAPIHKPFRFVIDALSINAAIEEVGIASSGNMAVPKSFTTVGWYKYGPKPGEPGVAVMAGHLDNALGLPGVFKNLEMIHLGDEIYVEEKSGNRIYFKVSEITTVDYTDKAAREMVFGRVNKPRLALITCIGSWIQSQKTYSKRLVVMADRI